MRDYVRGDSWDRLLLVHHYSKTTINRNYSRNFQIGPGSLKKMSGSCAGLLRES
jgi:hypothetical protein